MEQLDQLWATPTGAAMKIRFGFAATAAGLSTKSMGTVALGLLSMWVGFRQQERLGIEPV